MKTLALILFLGATAWAQGQRLPDGITARRDIPYITGGTERQRFDIYYPENSDKPRPLIIWIHGGAWQAGSKDRCAALPMLGDGFVVASVTYRFSQQAIFPAQIEDCKAAIRYLRAHAAQFHIDPARIGVWGASAGGHLVALLGVAGEKWDIGENLDQNSRVQAVVDFFGPADLLTMGAQSPANARIQHDDAGSPESKLIGGPIQENKDAARAASPVTYVDKSDAPILIVHGDKDPLVPHAQSVLFHDTLKKTGGDTTLKTIPGAGHGDGAFRAPETLVAVREFFKKHLQPASKSE